MIEIPLKAHRPARQSTIQMAFRWRVDNGPTLNVDNFVILRWIWTSIAKEPYRYVICSGEGVGGGSSEAPAPPTLNPLMHLCTGITQLPYLSC